MPSEPESAILKRCLLALSAAGARVWRNNVGALKDKDGRMIRYGVCNPGGSDVLGFRSITITPDMVGKKIAVFVAVEVKALTGAIRPEQQIFIDAIKMAGGIAGVARSADEAVALLHR